MRIPLCRLAGEEDQAEVPSYSTVGPFVHYVRERTQLHTLSPTP